MWGLDDQIPPPTLPSVPPGEETTNDQMAEFRFKNPTGLIQPVHLPNGEYSPRLLALLEVGKELSVLERKSYKKTGKIGKMGKKAAKKPKTMNDEYSSMNISDSEEATAARVRASGEGATQEKAGKKWEKDFARGPTENH